MAIVAGWELKKGVACAGVAEAEAPATGSPVVVAGVAIADVAVTAQNCQGR